MTASFGELLENARLKNSKQVRVDLKILFLTTLSCDHVCVRARACATHGSTRSCARARACARHAQIQVRAALQNKVEHLVTGRPCGGGGGGGASREEEGAGEEWGRLEGSGGRGSEKKGKREERIAIDR